MKQLLHAIDRINDFLGGKVMHWFTAVLVLVLTFEVTSRHIFNAPTMWANQLSMMLTGAIIAMGWGFVHLKGEHVRVDIFYTKYSPKTKAVIDIIGYVIIFFPLFTALTFDAWKSMLYSWKIREVMTETYWFPPVGPSRTVIFIGLALILLQGVAHFIRDVYRVVRGKTL